MKSLPLLLLLLLFSCHSKNTTQTNTFTTKIEQTPRAENNLQVTLKDILMDSIKWEKQYLKTGVYSDNFLLAWTRISDNSVIIDTSNSSCFQGPCYTEIWSHPDVFERTKKLIPEDDFYIGADDKMYYTALARELLDSCKIHSYNYNRDKRYMVFIGKKVKRFVLDSKKMLHAWGFILFNGKDVPTFWNGTDISCTIQKVFELKVCIEY